MSDIDLKALKKKIRDWYSEPSNIDYLTISSPPPLFLRDFVPELIDRLESAERRAEEAERALAAKPSRDWQSRCLERGFEYVRESDDHYVLADVPEMAGLLGELLGVEVRSKENESYGQTVRELRDELDAASEAHMRAYEAEKECAEQARLVGMGAERELGLMAKLAEAEKERDAQKEISHGLAVHMQTITDAAGLPIDYPLSDVLMSLDALRKDAERYRWLCGADVPPHSTRWPRWRLEYWGGFHAGWNPVMGIELDQAVDAAMAQEVGK